MKILQLNSVYGYGSTGRIVQAINNVILENGHEGYVAYGRSMATKFSTDKNVIRIGNNFDNYSHYAKSQIFDQHGYGSRRATENFVEKVEEINPDIIHLHNIHGYYINIEVFFEYLKKTQKPVIWTFHDCWNFTGHCAHYDYVKCDKWKSACSHCPQKRTYPRSLIIDNSYNNYLRKKELFTGINLVRIVTPSKWLKNEVASSFFGNFPITVIYNGIDLDIFRPRESGFREDMGLKEKFVVLGVANVWSERKGLSVFVEMANRLADEYSIVLVGLSQKQTKGLPTNIVGIERTNDAIELAQIYTAADVFVNPTLEDNFPTINIEALACGIPVITFNTGGSPESLNKECGIVVEKGNYEALLVAVKEYYINRPNALTCRERAKIYEKNLKYMEYIRLYETIYGRGRMD